MNLRELYSRKKILSLQRLKSDYLTKEKRQLVQKKKARVYYFNQNKEPQTLSNHHPLTKEDYKAYQDEVLALNAINEILLDMSKRLDNRFYSEAQFVAYFAKYLRFEMRDSVKTGKYNFRINANITPMTLHY